jgi:hypothetical protein
MSDRVKLKLYFYEDNELKNLLEYTGYELCKLLAELIKIIGPTSYIDLLLGKDYGLIECDADLAEELVDSYYDIEPESTYNNTWNKQVMVYFKKLDN